MRGWRAGGGANYIPGRAIWRGRDIAIWREEKREEQKVINVPTFLSSSCCHEMRRRMNTSSRKVRESELDTLVWSGCHIDILGPHAFKKYTSKKYSIDIF